MERFVLLPFSVGCISESSVAVGHHHQLNKSPSPEPKLTLPSMSYFLFLRHRLVAKSEILTEF